MPLVEVALTTDTWIIAQVIRPLLLGMSVHLNLQRVPTDCVINHVWQAWFLNCYASSEVFTYAISLEQTPGVSISHHA